MLSLPRALGPFGGEPRVVPAEQSCVKPIRQEAPSAKTLAGRERNIAFERVAAVCAGGQSEENLPSCCASLFLFRWRRMMGLLGWLSGCTRGGHEELCLCCVVDNRGA